jgi:hypothetical protein
VDCQGVAVIGRSVLHSGLNSGDAFGREEVMAISKTVTTCGSGLALAFALLAPVQALAQEEPAAVDESIVVTGSRVRGEAPVGSTVTVLGTADIASSGRVTLDRAIKELPQVFDLGVSENSRGQSGGSGNIVYGKTTAARPTLRCCPRSASSASRSSPTAPRRSTVRTRSRAWST